MANLESPNQRGDKGNSGGDTGSTNGGKLISPCQVGDKGGVGSGAEQAGGKLVSPSGKSNSAEGSGHGDGRGAKGNDAPKNRAWMS